MKLDKRLNAFRQDLADQRLEGQISCPEFVIGQPRTVIAPIACLRRGPGFDYPQDSQLLLGDSVLQFEARDGWAWIQNQRDRYVGYCPLDLLSESTTKITHRIATLSSFAFPEPDIKTHPIATLSMGNGVEIDNVDEKFSHAKDLGWIYNRHLLPIDQLSMDFVNAAEMFLNVPYLWGGNGFAGIDCSGLVQVSLQLAGLDVARDSDMQEKTLGDKLGVDPNNLSLKRGDLVFWPGHVGIMVDASYLLHANATHMKTTIDPLSEVIPNIQRIEGNGVSAIKRLGSLG